MAKKNLPHIHSIIKEWKTPHTYCNNFDIPSTESGVYAIIMTNLNIDTPENYGSSELIYIGHAVNLKQRYTGHEVMKILRIMFPDHHIAFYFKIENNYKDLEKKLIKFFQPRLNTQNVY